MGGYAVAIVVSCECGGRFRAKDEMLGKRVRCPKCGRTITVAPAPGSKTSDALGEGKVFKPGPSSSPPPLPRTTHATAAVEDSGSVEAGGPIPYAQPDTIRYRRPVLIPIVGIACLLVAALAIVLAVTIYIPETIKTHAATTPPRSALPPPPLEPAPTLRPYLNDVVNEKGLPWKLRQAIVSLVVQRSGNKLSTDRRAMLDWFLADAGMNIFPVSKEDLGVSPSAILDFKEEAPVPTGQSKLSTHVIVTPSGTLRLQNHRATFTGKDPRDNCQIEWHKFSDASGRKVWCSAAIQEALINAQTAGAATTPPVQMNTMQAAALVEEVRQAGYASSPEQIIELDSALPFKAIKTLDAGTIETVVNNRPVWLLANGAVARPERNYELSWDPATGKKRWQPPTQLTWLPVSPKATAFLLFDSYLGVILAVLSIALAVGLLFDWRLSRKGLLIYAALKIVAAVLVVGVSIFIINAFAEELRQRQMTPAAGLTPDSLTVHTVFAFLLQAALPVGLLICLNVRSVRHHFQSLREPPWLPRLKFARLQPIATSKVLLIALIVLGLLGVAIHAHAMLTESDSSQSEVLPHALAIAVGAIAVFAGWWWSRRVNTGSPAATSPGVASARCVLLAALASLLVESGAHAMAITDKEERAQLQASTPEQLIERARGMKPAQRYSFLMEIPSIHPGKIAVLRMMRDADPELAAAAMSHANRWEFQESKPNAELEDELDKTSKHLIKLVCTNSSKLGSDARSAAKLLKVESRYLAPAAETLLSTRQATLRRNAAELCAMVKDPPAEMMPAFTKAFQNALYDKSSTDDIRRLAGEWLTLPGHDAKELLLAVKSDDQPVRYTALQFFPKLGNPGSGVSPEDVDQALQSLSADPDRRIRQEAMQQLASRPPSRNTKSTPLKPVNPVVPPPMVVAEISGVDRLVDLMRQAPNDERRREAAHEIGELANSTQSGRQIANTVVKLLKDPNKEIRLAAFTAFEATRLVDYMPLEMLLEMTAGEDVEMAQHAAEVLSNAGYILRESGPVTRPRIQAMRSRDRQRLQLAFAPPVDPRTAATFPLARAKSVAAALAPAPRQKSSSGAAAWAASGATVVLLAFVALVRAMSSA
jgi:hypothetical protein